MNMWRAKLGSRSGQLGLVALLVVVLIAAILAVVVLLPKMRTKTSGLLGGKPMPQAAMERAKDVQCMSNLRSIREAIVLYKQQNETWPGIFTDLKMGVGADFFKCPVGKEDYQYDTKTGSVHCPHPGHEAY